MKRPPQNQPPSTRGLPAKARVQEPLRGPGCLYVIATPIGNLGDLAPRAREALSTVPLIASEAQTATRRLLSALSIPCPKLISYREDNAQKAQELLLAHLRGGEAAALVCEAGTPAISDPGWELVRACQECAIPVVAVAGPSSLVAALSVAGVPSRVVRFLSFAPHQGKARRDFLQRHLSAPETVVLFESPHRLRDTLADLCQLLGGQQEIVVIRELTKLYEETQRASLAEMIRKFAEQEPRGEFVLVIPERPAAVAEQRGQVELERKVEFLRSVGLSNRPILEYLTQLEGYARNQVYSILTDQGNSPGDSPFGHKEMTRSATNARRISDWKG